MAMIRRNVIIILGMHRSGTSLVSGILERLGVDFGGDLLGVMEGVNEKGFWEHRRLVEAHEALLASLQRAWYDISPLPEHWLEGEAAFSFKQEMRVWLEDEFKASSLFGLKDPRMCLFLPLWQQIFHELDIDTHYIVVERDPLEIAHSLMKRDNLPPLYSLALTNYYLSSIWKVIAKCQAMVVSYLDVLNDYKTCFTRVENSFHLGLDVNSLGENAGGILDFSLQHNKLKPEVLSGLNVLIHDYQDGMDKEKRGSYVLSNETRDYLNDIQHIWKQKHNELLEIQEGLASLGEEHAHAQSIVVERDEQLANIYLYMNKSWLGKWFMRRMTKNETTN